MSKHNDEITAPMAGGEMGNTWLKKDQLRLIAERVGTPAFIYSDEHLLKNIRRIQDAANDADLAGRVELYVPFFPNSNPHVLAPLKKAGVGVLLQLPSEYKILRRFGFDKFIVSPGHVSDDDIAFWAKTGHPLFLSSLDEIACYLATSPRGSVSVRLDSLGSGKPGIKYGQLQALGELLQAHGRDLECFELYCGSGHSVDQMVGTIEQVFMIWKQYFPRATSINFAGGYGFAYEQWNESEKHYDWQKYLRSLRQIADRYDVPKNVKFLFEPARDLLADVAVLLLEVKRKLIESPGAYQVLSNGSRVLIPSAQYKSRRHNVRFFDRDMNALRGKTVSAAMRGRAILRHDYILPGEYPAPETLDAGDFMVVYDVGAYCATQHMEFLNVPPAAEVSIDVDGVPHLITAPGDELDKWRHLLDEKRAVATLADAQPAKLAYVR